MSELYLRNLPEPFFNQRDNSYIWKQKYETDQKNKTGKVIHSKGEIVNNSINDINYSYVEKETLDILIDFERE